MWLIIMEPLTPLFLTVYTLTGVTDVLDGAIARKYGTTSEKGARLDSIADLMFYTISLARIMPALWRNLPHTIWYAVGALLVVRGLAYLVDAVKNHRFASIHTYLNKATGLLVFGVVYFINTKAAVPYCWTVCAVGMIASLQELYLHLKTKE